ncbi:hypothetical protein R1flu_001863 [Riccia fluitans]|uniref:Uncharacterized protein n=1 Tax=Riccia fluitans TaxID=41844 RepID=A0ABD1Y4G9_9MARC
MIRACERRDGESNEQNHELHSVGKGTKGRGRNGEQRIARTWRRRETKPLDSMPSWGEVTPLRTDSNRLHVRTAKNTRAKWLEPQSRTRAAKTSCRARLAPQ